MGRPTRPVRRQADPERLSSTAAILEALPRLVEMLPLAWLQRQRWFAAKAGPVASLSLRDYALAGDATKCALALIDARVAAGAAETYFLPLAFRPSRETGRTAATTPLLVLETPEGSYGVFDALADDAASQRLLELMRGGAQLAAQRGSIICQTVHAPALARPVRRVRPLTAEQSNTSLLFDGVGLLKAYRRLTAGPCRDAELARFFWEEAGFRDTPRLLGTIEYRPVDGPPLALAVLHQFVPNTGDGWDYMRRRLVVLLERVPAQAAGRWGGRRYVRQHAADLLADVVALARLTARMHRALGSRPDLPAYAPETITPQDIAAWTADVRAQMARAFDLLSESERLDHPAALEAAALRRQRHAWEELIERLAGHLQPVGGRKIQIHGDYHLGQVLSAASGFTVIDFEGEPSRPVEERFAKQSPLRDVAGMLRSFSYVAASAAGGPSTAPPGWLAAAQAWEAEAGRSYLTAYRAEMADSGLLPERGEEVAREVALFQLGKAFYEVAYELNNRPEWVSIPVRWLHSWRAALTRKRRHILAG